MASRRHQVSTYTGWKTAQFYISEKVQLIIIDQHCYYGTLMRDPYNKIVNYPNQFSFMARTHPQSLRQETSGRLRGP